MKEANKDRQTVQVRISKELHQDWMKACRKQSVNGSALIRKWMQEYVEEQKEGE